MILLVPIGIVFALIVLMELGYLKFEERRQPGAYFADESMENKTLLLSPIYGLRYIEGAIDNGRELALYLEGLNGPIIEDFKVGGTLKPFSNIPLMIGDKTGKVVMHVPEGMDGQKIRDAFGLMNEHLAVENAAAEVETLREQLRLLTDDYFTVEKAHNAMAEERKRAYQINVKMIKPGAEQPRVMEGGE